MQVQIKKFTGPLDLLLQLVRKEEMDIFDVDIHVITDQYLYVLANHPVPDLRTAGDFIKIAATLIYIKSKSLFPTSSSCSPDEEAEEDLQSALVKSLLHIQILQNVAKKLNQHFILGRDVWISKSSEGRELSSHKTKSSPKMFLRLLRAYYKTLNRTSVKKPIPLNSLPVLSDCIKALHPRLTVGSSFKMSTLIHMMNYKKRHTQMLMVFLSLLELSRLGIVSLVQNENFSDISVSVKKIFEEKNLSFVKEHNSYKDSQVRELM